MRPTKVQSGWEKEGGEAGGREQIVRLGRLIDFMALFSLSRFLSPASSTLPSLFLSWLFLSPNKAATDTFPIKENGEGERRGNVFYVFVFKMET